MNTMEMVVEEVHERALIEVEFLADLFRDLPEAHRRIAEVAFRGGWVVGFLEAASQASVEANHNVEEDYVRRFEQFLRRFTRRALRRLSSSSEPFDAGYLDPLMRDLEQFEGEDD